MRNSGPTATPTDALLYNLRSSQEVVAYERSHRDDLGKRGANLGEITGFTQRAVGVTGGITSLEMRAIDAVLEMGGGYVLDFSDRTFAEFFAEHGVQIDDPRYNAQGTSKAKRLRLFLRTDRPPLTGKVLASLLQHRLVSKPEGLAQSELTAYIKAAERLGGSVSSEIKMSLAKAVPAPSTEAELLALVFRPEMFAKLPVEPAMSSALIGRMQEAQRCIETKANLAAVILCGSVLEGMCLGFGCRHPERVNRAFNQQYNRPPAQLHKWKLKEWIDVLGRLGDLSPNIEEFGHGLRDFRNYVHPAEQLAHKFTPDMRTALIGFQVVVAAAEDLVRAEASLAADQEASG